MKKEPKFMILNLPSPPRLNVQREWAGVFGTASKTKRRDFGHSGSVLMPIPLMYSLSALLKLKCNLKFVDAQAENYNLGKVLDVVKGENPDVIISLVSLPSLKSDLEIINKIKETNERILVICLGSICRIIPEKILSENNVDIIIDAAYPYYTEIFDFAKTFKKGRDVRKLPGLIFLDNHKFIKNPAKSSSNILDEFLVETYKLIPIHKYLNSEIDINRKKSKWIPILTGVGCPYSCIYCPYPFGFGKWIYQKSITKIIEEIEFIVKNYNIRGFCMRDVVFTLNEKRVIDFCNEIIRKKLKIKWFFETRADKVNERLLKKMRIAGCFKINYGVETGSPELLKSLGKPNMSLDTITKAFKITKQSGIATQAHIIIGLPGETKGTLRETYNLIKELDPDEVNWNIITPYPGTKLYEMGKKNGWIVDYDLSKYTSFNSVMRTENFSKTQLKIEQLKMIWKMKLNKILFARFLR